MNRTSRAVLVGVALAVAGGFFASTLDLDAAPPDRSTKFVQIACKPGWRGGAGGQYGGIAFDVSCDNGRGTTILQGTSGTAYSVRMGVESDTVAVDCFFTGDAQVVNESCADVLLMVR